MQHSLFTMESKYKKKICSLKKNRRLLHYMKWLALVSADVGEMFFEMKKKIKKLLDHIVTIGISFKRQDRAKLI